MSNRGQMEIFGLVVIVILLSLGLLFAIVVLTKEPSREAARVKESVQAANFLNTIMGTHSVGCGKRTVRELVQNCATAGAGGIGAATCDDGTNTCEMAKGIISQMLEETLGTWGKNYRFSITGSEGVKEITASRGPCEGEREGSSRPEKVRAGLDVTLTLHICQ